MNVSVFCREMLGALGAHRCTWLLCRFWTSAWMFYEEHADFWRVWLPLHWIPSWTDQLTRLLRSDFCLTCELSSFLAEKWRLKRKVPFKYIINEFNIITNLSEILKEAESLWKVRGRTVGSFTGYRKHPPHRKSSSVSSRGGSLSTLDRLKSHSGGREGHGWGTQRLLRFPEEEALADSSVEVGVGEGALPVPPQGSGYSTMRLIQLFTRNTAGSESDEDQAPKQGGFASGT